MSKKLFFVGIILAAAGVLSPPLALTAGVIYGFSYEHPFHVASRELSKFLLQAAVVLLGFGMNLQEVLKVGRTGFGYTALSITCVMLVGLVLGRVFRVGRVQSLLICAGTAICGGSAIAAIGPVLNADEEEMAVSLGTVFVLNSVALLLFPFIGWYLHLTQTQFGLWAALAIHDTSSVVGASAKYGSTALAIGTTVKLARALWIVPMTLALSFARKSSAKIQWPWFIGLFCIAAVLSTYLPRFQTVFVELSKLGKLGLCVTLFLIGTGLSRKMLKQVGIRPLLQGLLLWILVAVATLLLIWRGLIHL
jgi:uncharacterized integral membrane protein (TIGR00698 family)